MTTYKYVLAQEGERKHDVKNTGEYKIVCEYVEGLASEYGHGTTWGHRATLYKDGVQVARCTYKYYNRTWERYTYESVMHGVLYKHKQNMIRSLCDVMRKHTSNGRLARGTKKNLQEIFDNIYADFDKKITDNALEQEF